MVPRAPMSVKVSYPQIRWHHVSWEGWHASHALDVRLVCNVVLGQDIARGGGLGFGICLRTDCRYFLFPRSVRLYNFLWGSLVLFQCAFACV